MRLFITALSAAFCAQSLPAMAQDPALDTGLDSARDRASSMALDHSNLTRKRRSVTAFTVQERPILFAAVTRRARADTKIRRAYMKERLAMGKVYPGYPQPPFITFDIRLQF